MGYYVEYGGVVHGPWCNTKTRPNVRCKYCGRKVFCFTCDCGSKVFFDHLGRPWPRHQCQEYLWGVLPKEILERAMEVQLMRPGIPPGYVAPVRQPPREPEPPAPRIVRCDPVEGQAVDGIGYIRELIAGVDVFKKLRVRRDSVLGFQLLGRLARGSWSQITLHTGHLAHEDAKSYSCLVHASLLDQASVSRGDRVWFALSSWSPLGLSPVWICETIECP